MVLREQRTSALLRAGMPKVDNLSFSAFLLSSILGIRFRSDGPAYSDLAKHSRKSGFGTKRNYIRLNLLLRRSFLSTTINTIVPRGSQFNQTPPANSLAQKSFSLQTFQDEGIRYCRSLDGGSFSCCPGPDVGTM